MGKKLAIWLVIVAIILSSFCVSCAPKEEITVVEVIKTVERVEIPKEEANPLEGKRFTSFGDSITYQNTWQPYLLEKYGLIHTNCGIGSTALSGKSETAFWQDSRLNAVMESNPDVVTILGGANDILLNPVLGTAEEFNKPLSEKDTNTFIGAYSYIIEKLLAWKPTLRIVILGTTWAHNDGKDYSDTLTYTDFSNASEQVAAYYGLPFADLHGECGFNYYTMQGENSPYSPDHIHPNDEGGKRIAEVVDKEFQNLFAFD